MKLRFIVLFGIAFLSVQNFAYADLTDNIDMQFLDNAFTNPNPTTNKQFEEVMQQYENPKEGFFTKVFKFFDKDKAKYDQGLKTMYQNENNQPRRIKDTPDEKPTVLISALSIDSFGNEIAPGYYQVEYKKDEGGFWLCLGQGSNPVATIKARQIDEDAKAPSIFYGRSENVNENYIKIIYANIDITLLAYVKVQREAQSQFQPLY